MASSRSDEAVHGSVESGSGSKPAPDPSYASAVLRRYSQDTTMPVNDHLSSAPLSQLGLSHIESCSRPIRSIDSVLAGQQPTSRPASQASAPSTTHTRVSDDVRGVRSSFDGFDASSPRPQVLEIDDDKTVSSSKK